MDETTSALPEPLRTILSTYFDVELFWYAFPSELKAFMALNPATAALFKHQFAEAITDGTISPEQYLELTNQSFRDEGKLYSWLIKLWGEIYGDEPITGDE